MRIYFSGSISGGRDQAHLYPAIIDQLRNYGEVLTEFVGDQEHTPMGEPTMPPKAVYQRDVNLINRCDVLVAEVTVPSFGVGVEIAHAGMQGKPVLALRQPTPDRRLSAMISGDPNVFLSEYRTLDEALTAVDRYFDGLASAASTP
ncbi:MAG: nucleoside 2-deoxyribosyltransferase [Fidelibacterota bacterium]|nr:MAG: nucleoside 2-deoxyribosyltransferase [Candidatus Neomarinimicrobiota bacterium]